MDNSELESIIELRLLSFYGWWQLGVCLFAFLALMGIWWHIGRRRQDFGQVWLALSVLCWSFSGGVEVVYAESILNLSETQLDGWRSIFSLFNSLFILLALPWFKYIPGPIEPVVKSGYWKLIVGLPFVFSLLPTISRMFSGNVYGLISELDVYYAILTLAFLGWVLWESFARRRLKILAWLSIVCILITFVAQLYKLGASDLDLTLYSSIFKTSLIMIFFALALSWVKELSENIIPAPHLLRLSLERSVSKAGRQENRVRVKGIPGLLVKDLLLSPASYDLLYTFASRRVSAEDDWLEIKPKSETRSDRQYDIRDHNEIKRMVRSLLDGLFGKGNWTENLHEQPFRNTLFESSKKRDRKIRLRLLPENIEV